MNNHPPTTKARLTGGLADRRKPPRLGQQTDDARLEQLADAIAEARSRPHDAGAARRAGRLACTVGLLLLPEDDDRRELTLKLLAGPIDDAGKPRRHAAAEPPPAASELEPDPDTADAAATQHAGDAGRLVGTTFRSNTVSPKGTVAHHVCVHPCTERARAMPKPFDPPPQLTQHEHRVCWPSCKACGIQLRPGNRTIQKTYTDRTGQDWQDVRCRCGRRAAVYIVAEKRSDSPLPQKLGGSQ